MSNFFLGDEENKNKKIQKQAPEELFPNRNKNYYQFLK
jgi:hypothetical protein